MIGSFKFLVPSISSARPSSPFPRRRSLPADVAFVPLKSVASLLRLRCHPIFVVCGFVQLISACCVVSTHLLHVSSCTVRNLTHLVKHYSTKSVRYFHFLQSRFPFVCVRISRHLFSPCRGGLCSNFTLL